VRIRFTASKAPAAVAAHQALTAAYGQADARNAEVIVALGGDGFMLQTLHAAQGRGLPVYGMNCGTIGFLMNAYAEDDLSERLGGAEEAKIHPLAMRAENTKGRVTEALAINEVSLLRQGPQAAKLRVLRRGAGGDSGGVHRVQLFGAWADPADRVGCAGADRNVGVPAPALARRAFALQRGGAL
jgi:NAD+ kinase